MSMEAFRIPEPFGEQFLAAVDRAAYSPRPLANLRSLWHHPAEHWGTAFTAAGFSAVTFCSDISGCWLKFTTPDNGIEWAIADDAAGETDGLLLSPNYYDGPNDWPDDYDDFTPICAPTPEAIARATRAALTTDTNQENQR